ncbi:MAG: asparagine synthase (glutamine-hydrolyzing) [Gallicola sp.]|nr:asparagine synthase (glutamine-hydrolyzing) [Gallicola sp.]
MCGIIGYIHKDKEYDPQVIKNMTEKIIHRGPDSSGFYENDDISFGFRRLSIIDLSSEADQPFYNADRTKILIFNGEIYNYKELREELIKEGYKFKSETDSEVIIHGYDFWGKDILDRLRGMFAFAVWDTKKKELFIARDPFGIKPLYYTQNTKDGNLIFGSEIKGFLENPEFIKELNPKALKPYLTFQYSSMKETFFKEVYKLPAGHYMLYKDGNIEISRYWEASFNPTDKSLEEYVEDIQNVMRESVDVHLQSDVKVGAFLSGGIDSSYVTYLSQPEDTFSVGFADYGDLYNETDIAKEFSDLCGFNHHKVMVDAEDCLGKLPLIQYHMDEPHSNLSAVPLYFLSELARKHATVVLSGEGADELFGGYFAYGESSNMKKYKKLPFPIRRGLRNVAVKYKKTHLTDFLNRGGQYPYEEFVGEAKIFTPEQADDILHDEYREGPSAYDIVREFFEKHRNDSELTKKQLLDINLWMPGDILLKADKMSSAHSLELRVPFLDKEVMNVAATIPEKYRVNGEIFKYALRKAASDSLPEDWAKRKKVGFPVPIRFWLKQDKYYNMFKETLSSDTAKKFFDTDKLLRLLEDHYQGKALNQRYLWTVYVFLIWYDEYFIKR